MTPPRGRLLPTLLTFAAALIPTLLFPGDAPWILDEPQEVAMAFQANADGRLASHALSGNFHVKYGPLPIQLKQLLLLVSHDLRVLIVLRVLLFSTAIAAGLLWLSRTLRLNPWLAPAIVLAPHLWLWTRQPWAAFLVTPLSIFAVAAHVSFLTHRTGRALAIVVGCAIAMPLIHPQSIPLSAVLLGHLALRHHHDVWAHKLKLLPVVLVLAVLNFQYVVDVIIRDDNHHIPIRQTVAEGHPRGVSRPAAFAGAFLGARLITPNQFESPLPDTPLTTIAQYAGLIPIALTWLGLAVAGRSLIRRDGRYPHDLAAFILIAYLVHAVFLAATRLPASPHYQFGSFGLNILTAWIALDALARFRFAVPALISTYAAGVACVTLGTLVHVHRHGWPATYHSSTLNEQIAVARALNDYVNETAHTNVSPYTTNPPHALLALRLLYPPTSAQPSRTAPALFICRSSATGRLELLELDGPPPGAKEIPLHYGR